MGWLEYLCYFDSNQVKTLQTAKKFDLPFHVVNSNLLPPRGNLFGVGKKAREYAQIVLHIHYQLI